MRLRGLTDVLRWDLNLNFYPAKKLSESKATNALVFLLNLKREMLENRSYLVRNTHIQNVGGGPNYPNSSQLSTHKRDLRWILQRLSV